MSYQALLVVLWEQGHLLQGNKGIRLNFNVNKDNIGNREHKKMGNKGTVTPPFPGRPYKVGGLKEVCSLNLFREYKKQPSMGRYRGWTGGPDPVFRTSARKSQVAIHCNGPHLWVQLLPKGGLYGLMTLIRIHS